MSPVPATTFAAAGAEALAALRAVVMRLRDGDLLAPVTVVAPGPVVAISLRRALGRSPGVANVEVVPLRRLAERSGRPVLERAGRRRAPAGAWEEAVRVALVADPGPFLAVRRHPATTARVAAALRQLRSAPAPERATFAAHGGRAGHLVALLAAVESACAAWYDDDDLMAAAARTVAEAGERGATVQPPVVAFGCRPVSPAADAFLVALAACGRLHSVVSLTGEVAADEPALAFAVLLDPAAIPPPPPPAAGPGRLVLAPDAEAETRIVVQAVAAAAEAGTPLHRIVVVAGGGASRVRLAERLDAAGIAWSGPSPVPLAASVAGRTALGLLGLASSGWSLAAVLGVLASAPIRREADRVAVVPAARWGRLARDANVVGGAAQLADRTHRHAAQLRRRGRHEDAGEADALAAFATELAGALLPPAGTWAALSTWAVGLLDRYLGPLDTPATTADWPEREVEALLRVHQAVAALASLDEVDRPADADPGPAELVAALAAALARPGPRAGRIGIGVLVASPAEAVGVEADLVLLSGFVEGAVPSRRADDPLVPEGELAVAAVTGSRARRRADERAAVLEAIAAGSRSIVSSHRAEHQADRRPSRWFLGWAGALDGAEGPLSSDELVGGGAQAWLDIVPSFAATLSRPVPGDRQERVLASLSSWVADGRAPLEHPAVTGQRGLRRSMEAVAARRSDRFTRFDGLAGPTALPQPASPSMLEDYLGCPQRWFLKHSLGVGERAEPEDTVGLESLTRGSLVHQALHQLLSSVGGGKGGGGKDGGGKDPDEPWTLAEHRVALEALAAARDDLVAEGRMGVGALATLRMEELAGLVAVALHLDDDVRADGRWVPVAAEVSFGADAPVVLDTPAGRAVALAGRIDRVDRSEDGTAVRVLDYKTGRGRRYTQSAKAGEPATRLLQLAVYELAARVLHPGADRVESAWWLLEPERGDHLVDNALTQTELGEVVDGIALGIESGLFPVLPGEERRLTWSNCQYCPYDRICPSDRARVLDRKASDPVLAPLVAEVADGGAGGA